MDREALVARMTAVLGDAVEAEDESPGMDVKPSSPLVGGEAVLSSMSLVSFIMDVESELESEYGIEVTLVNEQALSRKASPFRTVETLADYIMELAGAQSAATA